MLSFRSPGNRLCDGLSRREVLRAGGLSALGLSLPQLLQSRAAANPTRTTGKAKNCIVLFMLGGPPQHSTWDPKPDAPAEIRGIFPPISTNVPGIQIGSLFPGLAKQADKICFLRAVATDDNAHSSSGYYMLTGVPHAPRNAENVNPGAPNDWPTLGSIVRRLRGDTSSIPSAVRLPMHIFNTDSSIWPGQDAGFLGRASDPMLFRCEPGAANFRIPEFTLATDTPIERLGERRNLLGQLDRITDAVEGFGPHQREAFDLLTSPRSRGAFDLNQEAPKLRDRYGRHHFGQSCLLARRLIEAGVALVHVNWFRGPEEPSEAPCWDSHANENERMKTILAPTLDQGMSALLEDLSERGLLDETMVLCISEFGRTPRFNGRAGRDHWGHVFSVALAGGGIRGGQVYGASDRVGAHPSEGRVTPQDLTATFLYNLGYEPSTELRDTQNRPFVISRGTVLQNILV